MRPVKGRHQARKRAVDLLFEAEARGLTPAEVADARAALAIYALGVGAWLYHSIERYVVARRISTVRSAVKPFQPLLPVMGAIMGRRPS